MEYSETSKIVSIMNQILEKKLKDFMKDYLQIYKRTRLLYPLLKYGGPFGPPYYWGWNSCMLQTIETGKIPKKEESKPYGCSMCPKGSEAQFDKGWTEAIKVLLQKENQLKLLKEEEINDEYI